MTNKRYARREVPFKAIKRAPRGITRQGPQSVVAEGKANTRRVKIRRTPGTASLPS